MSDVILMAREMAFVPVEKSSPFHLTILNLAKTLAIKTKLVLSPPSKNPQATLDTQMRRETSRRVVDNLLR